MINVGTTQAEELSEKALRSGMTTISPGKRRAADPVVAAGPGHKVLDVITGRALAETALREPLRTIGCRPRAAGWFTRQIMAGFPGVVALGSASGHSRPGTAEIMLHAGIRDEVTEQVVSQLCGLKDEGYRQRTATAGIGYLQPDRSWREQEITPGNAGELARQLASLVHR